MEMADHDYMHRVTVAIVETASSLKSVEAIVASVAAQYPAVGVTKDRIHFDMGVRVCVYRTCVYLDGSADDEIEVQISGIAGRILNPDITVAFGSQMIIAGSCGVALIAVLRAEGYTVG